MQLSARARKGLTIAGLAALLVVLALRAWPFAGSEVDDVYIDMLHARNFVEHGVLGLDWKSAPTEGISSPLNVALHALGYALGLEEGVLVAVKLRVFLCASLAIVATFTLLRRFTEQPALPWIGAALLAFTPAYAYWSVAGVETPIYALLLLLAVDWLARPELLLRSAVVLGLLAITRPEGPLFAVLGVAFVALRHVRRGRLGRPSREELRHFAAWLALLVTIAAPYHVFRWTYFHAIFPNTYYAKINEHVDPWRGVLYVWQFVRDCAPWLIAAVPLAWLARRERGGMLVLAWTFVLAQLAVTVRAAGDWMPFYRFGVHVLPLATVITLCGVQDAIDVLANRRARASAAATSARSPLSWRELALRLALAAGSLGGCFFLVRETQASNVEIGLASPEVIDNAAAQYRLVAQRIGAECARRQLAPENALVALEPVGIVPYFSRTRVLDLSGKADRVIGSASLRFGKGREREKDLWVAGLVFERAPDFVCVSGGMNPGHQYATVADPRFPLWYEKQEDVDTLTIYKRRAALAVLPELHVVNRLDGVQLVEPATGRIALTTPDAVTARITEALARGDAVLVHIEFDSPLSRLEPLLALAHVRMSWREAGRYYRTVALEPGEQRLTEILPTLPLRAALDSTAPFQSGGPPRTLEERAPPELRIDCRGGDDLLLLLPLDVSAARICLIEATLKLERERGTGTGLYWSVHRAPPAAGTEIKNGSMLLHGVQDGWTEVGAIVRIPPGATHLQIGFGGFRNAGSVLRVRDARVLGQE